MNSKIVAIARYIENHCDEELTLRQMAVYADLSPYHLQRTFKAIIGVTPKEYLISCRIKKLKQGLRKNKSVTEALYEAGYSSSSRLYEKVDSKIGMTPRDYKHKGKGLGISWEIGTTSLGKIMIAATDRGICFIQFGDNKEKLLKELQNEFPDASRSRMKDTQKDQFNDWMNVLNLYLRHDSKKLNLPLDIRGTAFQVKVWKYLQKIPYGKTLSYTEVAKAIGCPDAVRAVAGACAKNKIALVIPCHRVLRGTGHLAGYRWGLKRKEKLLKLEKN